VILILNGVNDPNGAYKIDPKVFTTLNHSTKFAIVFQRVLRLTDIEEAISTLKENGKAIEVLWIRTHGYSQVIDFAGRQHRGVLDFRENPKEYGFYSLDSEDVRARKELLETQIAQLEKTAPIILQSCSTGAAMLDGQKNIAQHFAAVAGKRPVYAPTRKALATDDCLIFDTTKQQFKVDIKGLKIPSFFKKGSLLWRILTVFYFTSHWCESITQKFED
jgi:hypothetical protein